MTQLKTSRTVTAIAPAGQAPADGIPCMLAGQASKPHIKAVTKTVNVAIGRHTLGGMSVPCEYWASTDTDFDYGYGYEACYDPKRISLADAEQWVRTQLAEQGVNVSQFINEDEPDDTRLTYKAAAVYLANQLHDQALKEDDPAKTLDDIADALPEMFAEMGTATRLAAALLPEVAERIWTFAAIARARAEVGDDYGYVFDLMADGVRNGADPKAVRSHVPDTLRRIEASRIWHRVQEARDTAEGPWAGILDIVLAKFEEGADPQAVIDQVLGLMQQVRAEGKAS